MEEGRETEQPREKIETEHGARDEDKSSGREKWGVGKGKEGSKGEEKEKGKTVSGKTTSLLAFMPGWKPRKTHFKARGGKLIFVRLDISGETQATEVTKKGTFLRMTIENFIRSFPTEERRGKSIYQMNSHKEGMIP